MSVDDSGNIASHAIVSYSKFENGATLRWNELANVDNSCNDNTNDKEDDDNDNCNNDFDGNKPNDNEKGKTHNSPVISSNL